MTRPAGPASLPAREVQRAKDLVWELGAAQVGGRASLTLPHPEAFGPDVAFHGPAPVGECHGIDEMIDRWHRPLAAAFPEVRREVHVFLGGRFEGRAWVASTGNLVGRQVAPFHGVPAGPDEVRLRYGEFVRVEDGLVVEVRHLVDLPGLAAQQGHRLLPPFAGRDAVPPPPVLGNGVQRRPADPAETLATLQLVEDMVGGCNRLDERGLESMGMAAYWHDDMVWHGPWGVGSTHGFDEFQRDAQGPSVASFPDRRGGFHVARIAEGPTAAFTGWPSLRGTFDGEPFRGIPPTGGTIGQNLMDFYVRRDDRLHENWVLIDLVDFAAQCGVDLLAGLPS